MQQDKHGELSAFVQSGQGTVAADADRLFSTLYAELHRLAEHHLRRGGGTALTLGSTTVIHEAYLAMSDRTDLAFPDRTRFLAYASRAMRSLVIDYARRRRAQKRGRALEITLVGDEPPSDAAPQALTELEQLGDALEELAAVDADLASLVDMHFFGGLSFVEIASVRGVSEKTVQRDWRKARMLLQQSLLD